MRKFFRILLTCLLISAIFDFGICLNAALANDKAEVPREKQVRPKGSSKKKKTKSEQKRERDFDNNISSKSDTSSFEEMDEPKIDAIVLLDSSGSMLRTDPHRLRDQAAKLFIRFLSNKDRVSLFQFDQDVKRLTEFTTVTVESVEKLDEAIQSVSAEGRFTDLEIPLEVALSTLRTEARKDAKRIVILLSDGQMDPAPDRGDATALTEKLFSEVLPQYRADKTAVYTVAMSPEADKELLYKIATEGQGLRFEATDIQTLHKRFSDLYLSLKRPQVVEAERGGFEIDNSVDEATFYITHDASASMGGARSNEDASSTHSDVSDINVAVGAVSSFAVVSVDQGVKSKEIALYSPTNERITMLEFPPGVRWYQGELFDVVTIKEPASGIWRLEGIENPEGFATLVTDLKLQAKFEKTSMKVGDSQTVSARMVSGGKTFREKGLDEVTAYRYKVVSTVTGGVVQQGVLEDNGEDGDEKGADGVYSALIKAGEEGDYKLMVGVTSPTFSRQQQIPFEVSPGAIQLSLIKADEFEKAGDQFIVRLTSKGKKQRSPEIQLLVKNAEGKIVGYKLKAAGDDYRFETQKLAPGQYTVTARITSKNPKSGKIERSNSEAIEYEKVGETKGEAPGNELPVEDIDDELPATKASGTSYVGEIVCLVLSLLWAGGLVFYLTRRVDIGKSLPSKEHPFEIPESLANRVMLIEQRASKESRAPTEEEYELFDLVKSALPEVVVEKTASILEEGKEKTV